MMKGMASCMGTMLDSAMDDGERETTTHHIAPPLPHPTYLNKQSNHTTNLHHPPPLHPSPTTLTTP